MGQLATAKSISANYPSSTPNRQLNKGACLCSLRSCDHVPCSKPLNSLPRRRLLDGPTSIQRLHGIENALGSSSNRVQIHAKRDDLMPLGGGGNKLRKLEFLLGDAAAAGADTIIATGGRQSKFACLAAGRRPPNWVWRRTRPFPHGSP